LALELLLIVVLELLHVVTHVATKDELAVHLGIVRPLARVGITNRTGETTLIVRHIQTTISSTLEGTKDTSTRGGASQTNIEQSLEGLGSIGIRLDTVSLTIDFRRALVIQVEFLVDSAGKQ